MPKRSKVSAACDHCRQSKKRCSGSTPCERCTRLGKQCFFSRVPASEMLFVSTEEVTTDILALLPFNDLSESLAYTSVIHEYLETYSTYVNPLNFIWNCTDPVDLFSNITGESASNQLQFYSIMATTARALQSEHQHYINQARSLAKELFCTLTLEVAQGFGFLAFYYWSEDIDLSCHYREVSVSICRRLLELAEKQNLPTADREKILRVEFVAASLAGFRCQNAESERESTFVRFEQFLSGIPQYALMESNSNLITMNELNDFSKFRLNFEDLVFCTFPDVLYCSEFKYTFPHIDQAAAEIVMLRIQKCKTILVKYFLNREIYPVIASMLRIFSGFLYYSSGDINLAISEFGQAMQDILFNSQVVTLFSACCCPFYHLVFLICCAENRFDICHSVIQAQLIKSKTLKIAKPFIELEKKQLAQAELTVQYNTNHVFLPYCNDTTLPNSYDRIFDFAM